MAASIKSILLFLISYKYTIFFFFAIIEGRVLAMFAGFLVSLGTLSFWPAYILIILGNFLTDTGYFFIGKYGSSWKFFKRYRKKIDTIEKIWGQHIGKGIIFGKMSLFLVVPTLVFAGLAKFPYKKFLLYSVGTDIVFSAILMAIGYFSGSFYQTYSNYLYIFAALMTLIFIILFFIIKYNYQSKVKEK